MPEAEAEISIVMPVAARLAALGRAGTKIRGVQFFTGSDTIVVRESVRMHEDDDSSPGTIELPGSLSTARRSCSARRRRRKFDSGTGHPSPAFGREKATRRVIFGAISAPRFVSYTRLQTRRPFQP